MFNFFKKRRTKQTAPPKVEGILCIPGSWKERNDILHAIVEATEGEYIFAGMVLMNTKTGAAVKMLIEPRDETLPEKFRHLGMRSQVSEESLKQIDAYEQAVYLIHDTGSFDSAKILALAGRAILKAGGYGINVDTCNKIFEKDHWMDLTADASLYNLYEMFVHDAIQDEQGNLFSCGMQHLGLKDTIIYGLPAKTAHSTLKIWGSYQVIEQPVLKIGETFSIAPDAPRFRILKEKNPVYQQDELFYNPFGMWKLKLINPS